MSKHFDVVIVDEAAQAVEPSVMVPLVMGCKQVGAHIPWTFGMRTLTSTIVLNYTWGIYQHTHMCMGSWAASRWGCRTQPVTHAHSYRYTQWQTVCTLVHAHANP
jgi:hypothetical protein